MMMMMIPSFKVNGQLVLGKKIFKGFYIYGHGGRIGHVTLRVCTNFIPSAKGGSKRNLVTFGPGGIGGIDVNRFFFFSMGGAILFIGAERF